MNQKLINYGIVIALVLGVVAIVLSLGDKTIIQQIPGLGSVISPYELGAETCSNGLCTTIVSGEFKASSTIVSFRNPYIGSATSTGGQHYAYRATSTVEFIQLRDSGVATSTYSLKCGVSDYAGWFSDEDRLILSTGDIATSTYFGLLRSGVVNTTGYSFVRQGVAYNTSASTSIAFGPGEYFICKATFYASSETHDDAFTNALRSYKGNFWVKIVRGY